jgi:hypothetical protein
LIRKVLTGGKRTHDSFLNKVYNAVAKQKILTTTSREHKLRKELDTLAKQIPVEHKAGKLPSQCLDFVPMDLVSKDVGLFDKIAHAANVPVELSPLIVKIFKEGEAAYGPREFSPNIIRRYEEPLGLKVLGTGFPADMVDDEPEEPGYEVVARR